MILNDETRTRLLVPMTLTADPTGSTPELKIDGVWLPCVWLDAPVVMEAGKRWTQTMRTTGYFAGPAVTTPAGATVLALGRHTTETRVSWPGGDTIAAASSPIDVKEH